VGDLTTNLSRIEFACKCGCGCDTVDIITVAIIQDVCDHFNCKVIINSGCRCESHNAKIGGSKDSEHKMFRAGDCEFLGVLPVDVNNYLIAKYPGKYGFGVYKTFNHIDSRTNGPARWVG
jgi:uncharacterized protein YcbK (DUF882 family)